MASPLFVRVHNIISIINKYGMYYVFHKSVYVLNIVVCIVLHLIARNHMENFHVKMKYKQ